MLGVIFSAVQGLCVRVSEGRCQPKPTNHTTHTRTRNTCLHANYIKQAAAVANKRKLYAAYF